MLLHGRAATVLADVDEDQRAHVRRLALHGSAADDVLSDVAKKNNVRAGGGSTCSQACGGHLVDGERFASRGHRDQARGINHL